MMHSWKIRHMIKLFLPSGESGHMYKLFQHHSRIDARKYFFTERVVRVWNGLPAEQRQFSSLIQFKNFINSVDLSIYVSLGF